MIVRFERCDPPTSLGGVSRSGDPWIRGEELGDAVLVFKRIQIEEVRTLAIPARDLALISGYRLVAGRGYELAVNRTGKAATWLLYASLAFIMVTPDGTAWPRWLFWAGFALAGISLAGYLAKARREVVEA